MRKMSYYNIEHKYDFYIAGPLFTKAEKDYNLDIYHRLRSAGFKCFLPQLHVQDGDIPEHIYQTDLKGLLASNAVIAICDGADMDSGTAWECGKFHGSGKIFALRTDFRKQADDDSGINLMISQSADCIFYDTNLMIEWITKFIGRI